MKPQLLPDRILRPGSGVRCLSGFALLFLAMLLLFAFPAAASSTPADDVVAQARTLAYSGAQHRPQALALLKEHLTQEPDDSEARVLYGTILSWQGQYDEAREQLKQVLTNSPDHADALPALINVELWSGHPASAEQLAHDALLRRPDRVNLMIAEAHALDNLNRPKEALALLDRVLQIDPSNNDAREMRRRITVTSQKFEFLVTHSYDWFSDGRNGQHETSMSMSGPTGFGSVVARLNRADRFGFTSYQEEADFYPHFRSGTYGYLNFGYSADGNLYPSYRIGAELFQSLPKGFEASGGYRHLDFSSGVDIYTFSLAKYYRNFLFTGRGFVVPGSPGTSGTGLLSVRYFLGSEGLHDYVEFRYSHGASPAQAVTALDIEVLSSSKYSAVLDKRLATHWLAEFSGSLSQSQQLGLSHLRQYEVQGYIFYRF
jgi:YaiO family outer membrane protein